MAEDQSIDRGELLALTAEIVAAHVGNNAVAGTDLGGLIQSVFDTLRGLGSDEPKTAVELTPAVPIKRSVTDDYIVCLEDGKKLKDAEVAPDDRLSASLHLPSHTCPPTEHAL